MLIRQRGCAGWSASLLFAYETVRFSHDEAHFSFGAAEFTIIMPISLFQIDISNQLEISLELDIDISNAVIGLLNTDNLQ